jgi:gliding motility-associated-like protein
MRTKHFLLLLFILPSLAVAQYDSRLGRFRVDEIKGCAPFTVTITDANLITTDQCTGGPFPLPNNPCDMTWSDGTVNQNTFTHTYTQPGTYLLSVLYQSMIPREDDIVITVTPNTQPAFDIYTCSGLEVQVKVTDTAYDSYFINYGDGSPEVPVPVGMLAFDNYTYAAPGINTISVRGKNLNAADNCIPAATKTVDVVNALPTPFIDLLTVTSGTQIDLNFTASNNVLYRVEGARNTEAPASFQLVQTIHDVNTVAITNSTIRTDDNYYCARLGAFDPCNNTTVYSNIICSANFDLLPQNNMNSLTWSSATTGVSNFDVTRDGVSIGTTGALTFSDNTVVCKTNYCYQLLTNYANGSQSISLEKCGVAFSSDIPAAIENITAVVGDGSVDLTWQQDPAFQPVEYSIFRKSGSGNFSLLSKTVPTQFTDADYGTEGVFCYQINYTDVCGNVSAPGVEACPIRLSASIASDNSINLNWSAYTGWMNGVNEYIVDKYDGEGVPLQTFNVGTATTFEDSSSDPDNQLYVYIIIATANDGGLGQSISNEVTAIKEPNLFYPKAFTPNGDNLNDIFLVFGQYLVEFELNIFNRWGELLFSTDDINRGWDGKFKGNAQPEGTYTFIANLTDLAGRTFKRSGSVVLLRKK